MPFCQVLLSFALIVAGARPVLPGSLEETELLERSVKAAFLFKFPNYVDWPSAAFGTADAPIVIGVAGSEGVARELQQIVAGRTGGQRPVVVRQLREGDSLADVQVLFIGRSDAPRMQAWLRAARDRPILTVTEAEAGLEQGAVINFVLVQGRVRFDISLEAAERSGLKVSSRLLAVAQQVRKGAS